MGIMPMGTMPHALILVFNDQLKAWKAFDDFVPGDVPRIALIYTLCDEKLESIIALELLKERLHGIRIDTPSSRRGSRRKIVEEARWEINL